MTIRGYINSVIFLFLLVGSGCAASAPPATIVCGTCEEPARFVRLQSPTHPSSPVAQEKFSHPLTLSPEQWKPILSGILVKAEANFFKKRVEEAAFEGEDIEYLSMTLSRAFAKASPDQWVVFGLSTPSEASGSYMTTGAWYAKGSQLHLLLPNVQAPVRLENLRQVLDKDPMYRVLEATRYEFLPTRYAQLDEGPEKSSVFSWLAEETPHLVIDYQQVLSEVFNSKKSPERRTKKPFSEKSHEGDSLASSLEERLSTLKRLREKELISEDDYQRRKQELLDEL